MARRNTGVAFDTETAWLDYGARMYDPTIGRMTTIDRAASMFSDVSPYSYGLNSPLLHIDPSGDTTYSVNDLAANWSKFDTEVDNVQLGEVAVRPDGAYGSGGLAYTSSTRGVVAGYSAGYIGSGEYGIVSGSTDFNVTGFRAEYNNYTGTGRSNLALDGGVKVTGFQTSGAIEGGFTDILMGGVGAEGNVLLAEAKGTVGKLTGENNRKGYYLGGEAGAYALKGEINPSITILGYKIGVVIEGSVGSVSIGAGLGGYRDSGKGTYNLSAFMGGSFMAGGKLKFELIIPSYDISKKRK